MDPTPGFEPTGTDVDLLYDGDRLYDLIAGIDGETITRPGFR